jgi:ribosomal protein S18 acetylase RimI-like enzyme
MSLVPTHTGQWTRFKFLYDGQHMGECQIVMNDTDWHRVGPGNRATISSVWGVEIYQLYRGQGHSKRLMQEVLHFIAHQAPGRVWLWVKRDNEPAIRTYEATGFTVIRKHNRAGDLEMEALVRKCECQL